MQMLENEINNCLSGKKKLYISLDTLMISFSLLKIVILMTFLVSQVAFHPVSRLSQKKKLIVQSLLWIFLFLGTNKLILLIFLLQSIVKKNKINK